MKTRRLARFEGVLWIVTGLVVCYFSWRTHLGSFSSPGPGSVAFVAGVFIAGIGLIMALSRAFSKIDRDEGPEWATAFRQVPWPRLLYVIALLFAYAVFLNSLGYVLCTFFVMLALFYDREKRNWSAALLKSLVVVICSYLLFEVWLSCQFPRGIFPR